MAISQNIIQRFKINRMKYWIHLILLCFLLQSITAKAQTQKITTDSSVLFKVNGLCEQCKNRIEEAVKGKGVLSANWNIDTKMLALEYNPSIVSLAKIQKRILAAGHDVETIKATDAAYNSLPSCCRYREAEKAMEETMDSSSHKMMDAAVKGVVLEATNKGEFKPLAGADIVWLGSHKGVVADSNGMFSIDYDKAYSRLVVSYSGYRPDTISVSDMKELKVILATGKQLAEVTVTGTRRSSYLANWTPIRTEIMTDKELFKAACCNLSESFETNPSVDVSYSDAVTGAKQIQLLGLSGIYTQLTVENMPGPRGIATALGLNSIAGPWVESIQLTKGIGSVANGYESIAGQINVELKKPENSEQLFANAYVNGFGKTDLNLNLAHKLNKKWSTALLLHDDFLTNKQLDFNKDGFRDLPTGNQFSLINRWKYDNAKGLLAQFGIELLNEQRVGGQVNFNPSVDKGTTNSYGVGINTQRYEAFGKLGYVFPAKKYKSIGLQVAAISHQQDAYFGLTTYNAAQHSFYSNLIYQSIIGTTANKFRTGFSFSSDNYNETFNKTPYLRTENVPGAFFEYTYDYLTKFTVVAGLRSDYDNLYGFFVTPRLHIRYEPVKGTTIRLSGGRGQRTADIFAENMSSFVSSRQVMITASTNGKAYGLNPEVAWNKGISIDQKLKLFQRDGLLSIDFYRNDFSNQVVVDLENPRVVNFYNLQGKSYSNSFQVSLDAEPVRKLDVKLAYRYFDVKTTYDGSLLERPFTAANRAFASVDYTVDGWKFDYTVNYTGRKRIPNTAANPMQYQLPEYSPAYFLMNAQVTKTVGKKHPVDIYFGSENLGNYYQKDAIVAAAQPFSQYFDASMIWGPVYGRMFYGGVRYKIK